MQITKFSDLALRLLIHLAVAGDERISARAIADRHGLSFNHLAKVAQWLTSEGYLDATRGRGGGLTLAKRPEEISIGVLLRKSEQGSALVECLRDDGGACLLTPCCGLLPLLLDAQEAFFAQLDDKTIADTVGSSSGAARLLARRLGID